MKIYMVTSYSYDGCYNYDSAPYFPASTEAKAIEYMFNEYVMQWEGDYEFRIVDGQIRVYKTENEGKYSYWYLYIEEMELDKECN